MDCITALSSDDVIRYALAATVDDDEGDGDGFSSTKTVKSRAICPFGRTL